MKNPLWGLVAIFIILAWVTPDGRAEAVWWLMHDVTLLCIFVQWVVGKLYDAAEKQTKKVWHD